MFSFAAITGIVRDIVPCQDHMLYLLVTGQRKDQWSPTQKLTWRVRVVTSGLRKLEFAIGSLIFAAGPLVIRTIDHARLLTIDTTVGGDLYCIYHGDIPTDPARILELYHGDQHE